MDTLSLFAAVVGTLAGLGYFYDKWRKRQRLKSFSIKNQKQLERTRTIFNWLPDQKRKYVNELFTYLENDQDKEDIHRGEFGRGQRLAEEEGYQSAKLKMDIKPRLYLTGIPLFTLLKYKDKLPSEQMIELVESGILDLFDDCWITLGLGAWRNMNPIDHKRVGKVISYRHTIRGAQLLFAVNNLNIPKSVLGKMLDSSADMQTKSGGWRQGNIDILLEEDLWGSAYAASFLHTCLENASMLGLDSEVMNKGYKSLEKTLSWLDKKWKTEEWIYGEVPTEENAPILFPEIAKPVLQFRPNLANSVLKQFRTYYDPTFQPSSSFLAKHSKVGQCGASARLAYNFFITKEFQDSDPIWQTLRDYSLQHLKSGYNCIEAAMLLDMLLEEEVIKIK